MTFKKFIIIFLLILTIFSFSSVHAENINITTLSSQRMQTDIDYLKQLLKKNNINNMNDLMALFGAYSSNLISYIYIEDAGHTTDNFQFAYFYSDFYNISNGVNDYSYYGIQQNSFTLPYNYSLRWFSNGAIGLTSFQSANASFTAPACW